MADVKLVLIVTRKANDAIPVNEVQLTNEQSSPTFCNVVCSNTRKNKVGDVTDEDSDSEVDVFLTKQLVL